MASVVLNIETDASHRESGEAANVMVAASPVVVNTNVAHEAASQTSRSVAFRQSRGPPLLSVPSR